MNRADQLLQATRVVEAAVKNNEAVKIEMTWNELKKLFHYQSTLPTSPRIGFKYRKQYWREPEGALATGPNEASVRLMIGKRLLSKDSYYREELPEVWFIYEVIRDPEHSGYVLHVPTEVILKES